jgi:hypothetical protein
MPRFPVTDLLKIVLICKKCSNPMGEYDLRTPMSVRKCENPECTSPNEYREYIPNSAEDRCFSTLKLALRNAMAKTRQRDFAFKIWLEFPERQMREDFDPPSEAIQR